LERFHVQIQRPQRGEHLRTGIAFGGKQGMGLALAEAVEP
jgi:hypothetical protein